MNDQPEAPAEDEDDKLFFHIAAATAVFRKDGDIRQRNVNIVLETESHNILRSDLNQVNHGVVARVHSENGVDPADIVDIIILNISMLAAMVTREEFYGSVEDQVEAEEPVAEDAA